MLNRILLSFIFIFFLSLFSINRLNAISEFDVAFTYVHPLIKDKPYGGFTLGTYKGLYEKLPVHFGIRVDFSINLLETDKDLGRDILNNNVRMPLFIGLRISHLIKVVTFYAEFGPEGSFDFDYEDSSLDFILDELYIPTFSFNFGGAFGFGFNVHISSFIIGAVFRYHIHLDHSRQYFTTGIVLGGEI